MAPKHRPSALRAVLTRQRARAARGCASVPRAAGRTAAATGIDLIDLKGYRSSPIRIVARSLWLGNDKVEEDGGPEWEWEG